MATWYLLNTIRYKDHVLQALELINDAQTPLSLIASAGGIVVPAANATVAAAAAIALKRKKQGADADVLTSLMLAAAVGGASCNRQVATAAAGATVAAAANIVPALSFTPVLSGKVRVKAWASLAALTAGTFTPLVKQGSTTIAAPGKLTGAASQTPYNCVVDFELDGLALYSPLAFTFVTTAGDATVTLGAGSSGVAASFSVEEVS